MVNVGKALSQLREQPGYTAMRGFARFPVARQLVSGVIGAMHYRSLPAFVSDCEARMPNTLFPDVNRQAFLSELKNTGLAFGLTLPSATVDELRRYADEADCYADRKPQFGFKHEDRKEAEVKLGKTILVAQYFNTMDHSAAVRQLANDPLLNWVAAKYLGAVPKFLGANMWWTFPTNASEEDRNKHAHLFHRDVDDFRFFKFFFYLTDVEEGDGAHVCVAASNKKPPVLKRGDQWAIRRYTDAEIESFYPASAIKEISGKRGTGFAEDTLCIHKGSTPKRDARLLLQLQYGLLDYGAMHDRIEPANLKKIA